MNNQKAVIVGLSAKKGGGKSPMADYLVENAHLFRCGEEVERQSFGGFQYSSSVIARRFSFAKPLKEFVINILGVPRELVYGTDDDKNTPTSYRWRDLPHYLSIKEIIRAHPDDLLTVRELLQEVGTIGRMFHKQTWSRATLLEIERSGCDLAFIDDVRFFDEVDLVRAAGGHVIRFMRAASYADPHISEIALDNEPKSTFSAVIDNRNQTLDETKVTLINVLVGLGLIGNIPEGNYES